MYLQDETLHQPSLHTYPQNTSSIFSSLNTTSFYPSIPPRLSGQALQSERRPQAKFLHFCRFFTSIFFPFTSSPSSFLLSCHSFLHVLSSFHAQRLLSSSQAPLVVHHPSLLFLLSFSLFSTTILAVIPLSMFLSPPWSQHFPVIYSPTSVPLFSFHPFIHIILFFCLFYNSTMLSSGFFFPHRCMSSPSFPLIYSLFLLFSVLFSCRLLYFLYLRSTPFYLPCSDLPSFVPFDFFFATLISFCLLYPRLLIPFYLRLLLSV